MTRRVLLGAALAWLMMLVIWGVVVFAAGQKYDRAEWLPRWAASDQPCAEGAKRRDTRQAVLFRELKHPRAEVPSDGTVGDTVELSPDGCRILRGAWLDLYGDSDLVTDPTMVHVDHVVPLSYAAQHGGGAWPTAKKREFANWLAYRRALIPVGASANRSKGDRGPAAWIPRNPAYWCTYAESWSSILIAWDLRPDEADRSRFG